MTQSGWVTIYFAVVLLDALVSLIEEILFGVPTYILSLVAILVSLPMLVQSLRGRVSPRGLLVATSAMEVAAPLLPILVLWLRVPLAGIRVLTYVPLGAFAVSGLTRATSTDRVGKTSLARVSLLLALTSGTLVALELPDIASRTALVSAVPGLVGTFAGKDGRERFCAAMGCVFNLVVVVAWARILY